MIVQKTCNGRPYCFQLSVTITVNYVPQLKGALNIKIEHTGIQVTHYINKTNNIWDSMYQNLYSAEYFNNIPYH